jgi:AmiR/NasT family two-component response regulator
VTRTPRIPNLGGARAFILHRSHPTLQAITRQLSAIGLITMDCWPELPPEVLIARQSFEARKHLAAEIAALRQRVAERQTIVRAVTALSKGSDDERAYAQLRSLAMSWQISVEDAARRIVAMTSEEATGEEGGDDQSHRA